MQPDWNSLPPELLAKVLREAGLGNPAATRSARSVCRLWRSVCSAVAPSLHPHWEVTDEQLARLVRIFPGAMHLDLAGCCQVSDAGLLELRCLNRLADLNLSRCSKGGVTDVGLAAVAQCSRLTQLRLSAAHGPTDAALPLLASLPQLRRLTLGNCGHFTNEGFLTLARASGLEELRLVNMYASDDSLHPLLAALQGLTSLDISYNRQVSGEYEWAPGLLSVSLASCEGLVDAGVQALAHRAPRLAELRLSSCRKLTGEGFAALQQLGQLTRLDLEGCYRLTDDSLAGLAASLPRLQSLNISTCGFVGDEGLAAVGALVRLSELRMKNLQQVTAAGLLRLSSLTELSLLDAMSCRSLEDDGLAGLRNAGRLTSLDLSGCNQLSNGALRHLSGLTQLKKLSLRGCNRLTDAGLKYLLPLPQLAVLDVNGCKKVTEKGLWQLQALKHASSEMGALHLRDLPQGGVGAVANDLSGHAREYATSRAVVTGKVIKGRKAS